MFRNGLEPWHLIVVLAVVLLFVGGAKLPELARGMGRSIRVFKHEVNTPEVDSSSGADGGHLEERQSDQA